MAGVSIESKGGGRKSVDSNVNMVPMIDLLISVIAFLLMTAVWVQTGSLMSRQPSNTQSATPPPPATDPLRILIRRDGLHVGQTAMDSLDIGVGPQQREQLRQALARRHAADGTQRTVWIQPDSAVSYSDVIDVMDVVYDVWGQGRPAGSAVRDRVDIQLM